MRILATFEKQERLRHIGHLDIMRAMQRALRRSGLPVSYSKGFNPHILLTFASALSVGAASTCEIMEVSLDEPVEPGVFMARMNEALPPEMQLTGARAVDEHRPAAMALVRAARYDIRLPEDAARTLGAAIPGFLAQAEIITDRKTKSGVKPCDIRPLIHALEMRENHLLAELALTETLSCKPAMLLTALCAFAGMPEPQAMVTRTRLLGETEAGAIVPLEEL